MEQYRDIPRAFSKMGLIVILLIFVYLFVLNIKNSIRNKGLDRQIKQLKITLSKEQSLNRELKNKKLIISDPITIETMARDKLGLVKQEETLYKISRVRR